MSKPFPYKDDHSVSWKCDAALISTYTRKEKACSNISLGLAELTRSGQCYTLKELEKKRNELGKVQPN